MFLRLIHPNIPLECWGGPYDGKVLTGQEILGTKHGEYWFQGEMAAAAVVAYRWKWVEQR